MPPPPREVSGDHPMSKHLTGTLFAWKLENHCSFISLNCPSQIACGQGWLSHVHGQAGD